MMVGGSFLLFFPKRRFRLVSNIRSPRSFCRGGWDPETSALPFVQGEILGIAGLVGAGRTELAKTIFGLVPPNRGQILLKGKPISIRHPIEAIGFGIAYLPEDRRRHGVVLDLPISSNITLASLNKISRFIGLDLNKERSLSADLTRRLGVKTPTIYNSVATLSGGNQQKVALSRWLLTKPCCAYPGRADAGHRRRCEGGDPPVDDRTCRAGRCDRNDLVRASRDPRYERPHRRNAWRHDRSNTRTGRGDPGPDPRDRVGQ